MFSENIENRIQAVMQAIEAGEADKVRTERVLEEIRVASRLMRNHEFETVMWGYNSVKRSIRGIHDFNDVLAVSDKTVAWFYPEAVRSGEVCLFAYTLPDGNEVAVLFPRGPMGNDMTLEIFLTEPRPILPHEEAAEFRAGLLGYVAGASNFRTLLDATLTGKLMEYNGDASHEPDDPERVAINGLIGEILSLPFPETPGRGRVPDGAEDFPGARYVKEGWVTVHPLHNTPVEVVPAAYVFAADYTLRTLEDYLNSIGAPDVPITSGEPPLLSRVIEAMQTKTPLPDAPKPSSAVILNRIAKAGEIAAAKNTESLRRSLEKIRRAVRKPNAAPVPASTGYVQDIAIAARVKTEIAFAHSSLPVGTRLTIIGYLSSGSPFCRIERGERAGNTFVCAPDEIEVITEEDLKKEEEADDNTDHEPEAGPAPAAT
jgi:hypothetical protein